MFITDRQLLRLQVVTDMFNNIEYTIRHKQVEQGRFRTVFPSERNCMFISIVTRVPSQPGHMFSRIRLMHVVEYQKLCFCAMNAFRSTPGCNECVRDKV